MRSVRRSRLHSAPCPLCTVPSLYLYVLSISALMLTFSTTRAYVFLALLDMRKGMEDKKSQVGSKYNPFVCPCDPNSQSHNSRRDTIL